MACRNQEPQPGQSKQNYSHHKAEPVHMTTQTSSDPGRNRLSIRCVRRVLCARLPPLQVECGGDACVNWMLFNMPTSSHLMQHHTNRPRNTNPLQPVYQMPTALPDPSSKGHWTLPEGHVFHNMRHPEWSFNRGSHPLGNQNRDIDGSCAARPRPQVQIGLMPYKQLEGLA